MYVVEQKKIFYDKYNTVVIDERVLAKDIKYAEARKFLRSKIDPDSMNRGDVYTVRYIKGY